jgi:hypothetical protein
LARRRATVLDERRDVDDRNTLERITLDAEAIIAAKVTVVEILVETDFAVVNGLDYVCLRSINAGS